MIAELYNQFVLIWTALAVVIFMVLLFITAPYGRHVKKSWGPLIDNRTGWIIMELFVLVALLLFVLTGKYKQTLVNWLIIGIFSLHYINRSLIFPFRLRTNGKKMPISIMFMGIFFNLINGFLIGYYLGNCRQYPIEWFYSGSFISGTLLFILGMTINWKSDNYLINLRKPGETGYKIPSGRLFNYVSCPNLLGEIIEWGGFAILTWSIPGLAFFIWTCANLIPRAISHHRWYKSHFENYPTKRKAILPYLI
ncbi:MAG: 3-oxo-5-alpha-steroid 4-dehydrogenase [Saprospiraceae bacterium]|nr:3-oxo-5-alpha-steroid 4-dehydrogenase [Saprospiraceae bacterium]